MEEEKQWKAYLKMRYARGRYYTLIKKKKILQGLEKEFGKKNVYEFLQHLKKIGQIEEK